MKKIISNLSLLFLLISGISSSAYAQSGYTFFQPKGSFAIEVSLQNSPYNRLPIYQNSISSLTVVGDHIIGGTSAKAGLSPYVFVASLSRKKLIHKQALDKIIPGQQRIQSGFCKDGDVLYAGSMASGDQSGASGHLIKINVGSDGNINIADLGKPIAGEGIYALTCNADKGMIYGISYPSGFFFSYNIHNSHTNVYRSTGPSKKEIQRYHHLFGMQPADYLSKRLIVDGEGRVYGSEPVNKLFYYDPEADSIHVLKDGLPYVWGRHTLGRVDAWAKSKNGMLYGGNAGDGQLFKLDPSTEEVTNLGKPIMMNRLKALAFAKNGKLYGIAGGSPGYAHLFRYDAKGKGFVDLGNPQFRMVAHGIEQGIAWRGFQLGTMAASEDGKYMVMGEDESLSQLMIFPVIDK